MAAFDRYPSQTATYQHDSARLTIRLASGSVYEFRGTDVSYTASYSITATPYANDAPYWDDFLREESLPPKRQPFFPARSRAPMPARFHVQAPRARPRAVQRLHHFASQKVWERRNKPTPPRKDASCPTTT